MTICSHTSNIHQAPHGPDLALITPPLFAQSTRDLADRSTVHAHTPARVGPIVPIFRGAEGILIKPRTAPVS
jgi:hypothetical protein